MGGKSPLWLPLLLALGACSCDPRTARQPPETGTSSPVASWNGGSLASDDLQREANRLPPSLRDAFEQSNRAKIELAQSLIDKRLLAAEARRRGLANRVDIMEQIQALEDRLIIQALLKQEEEGAPGVTEEQARAWFDANRTLLVEPERLRVRRILFSFNTRARSAAFADAERARKRIQSGADPVEVAREGTGPERLLDGDLGWRTRTEMPEGLADTAWALLKPGQVSPVIETREGVAVLVLTARESAANPSFEDARGAIVARLEPERKRQVLKELLERLRQEADIHLDLDFAR